jgi:hypothetical protein
MPNPTVDNSNPAIVYALRGNIEVPKSQTIGADMQAIQTVADTELESRLTPATTASVPLPHASGTDFPSANGDTPTG